MAKNKNQTIIFDNKISFLNGFSIVGEKEGDGNFGKYFEKKLMKNLREK